MAGRRLPGPAPVPGRRGEPGVVVSTAYYGNGIEQSVEVVRVCSRATKKDPVVLQDDSEYASSDDISRATATGPWVVLVLRSTGKGANCVHESVEVVNAVDGTRRRADAGCWSFRTELGTAPMVVTDTGFPAWILRYADRSAVVTTSGGELVELDSAGRDGITELAVEGRIVRWLHDGEPRSADLG